MPTFTKIPLSQSTNGKSILLSLSASPGTLIHTTSGDNATIDEVWLYASNNTTYDSNTTFFWGNTAVEDLVLQLNVQAYTGMTMIFPGTILKGDGVDGSTIYAYTQIPSAVNITGYINRIIP